MPMVNLIQEQRLAAQRVEKQARAGFFGFAATGIAVVAAYGFLLFQNTAAAGEEAKLRADRQKLAPTVAKIEANEKELLDLEPRLKTLSDAQMASDRWAGILAHLSQQTPKDVWLTSMRSNMSDPTKPILVSFLGVGLSQDPIGEFMMRIQNEKDLDNVNLRFTQEKIVNNNHTTEFEIAAEIGGTAEQKPKEIKDDKEDKP